MNINQSFLTILNIYDGALLQTRTLENGQTRSNNSSAIVLVCLIKCVFSGSKHTFDTCSK